VTLLTNKEEDFHVRSHAKKQITVKVDVQSSTFRGKGFVIN